MPRDVIQYRLLVDDADPVLDLHRGGLELQIEVAKADGEPLGIEVHSALFDQVRTCDNHCEFCFIYQLPPGMRESLYLKDDDYRLSFLYGNFTTLTRFTEADLERVVTERLSPLNVSIHATDPEVRTEMLRNRRGATSLRWLRALLDHDIEVHGQIVVCPGINDGAVLDDTLAGVLDRVPGAGQPVRGAAGGQPLVERAARCAPTAADEAAAVIDAVHDWQDVFLATLGHRLVFAADEYYLLAGRPFPDPERYEGFAMHEDGIGMARTFEAEFLGLVDQPTGVQPGLLRLGRRRPGRGLPGPAPEPSRRPVGWCCARRPRPPWASSPVRCGAAVLEPLVATLDRPDVRVVTVANEFFGGNIGVTGLMVGEDLARTLAAEPEGHRYLLPDVCLSQGRFLDGTGPGGSAPVGRDRGHRRPGPARRPRGPGRHLVGADRGARP